MAYRPANDVIVEEQRGEAFLLHVPTARYFGLNRAGQVVWSALRDGDDPVGRLAASHPAVPEATLQADVDRLLGRLVEAGLVTVED